MSDLYNERQCDKRDWGGWRRRGCDGGSTEVRFLEGLPLNAKPSIRPSRASQSMEIGLPRLTQEPNAIYPLQFALFPLHSTRLEEMLYLC